MTAATKTRKTSRLMREMLEMSKECTPSGSWMTRPIVPDGNDVELRGRRNIHALAQSGQDFDEFRQIVGFERLTEIAVSEQIACFR